MKVSLEVKEYFRDGKGIAKSIAEIGAALNEFMDALDLTSKVASVGRHVLKWLKIAHDIGPGESEWLNYAKGISWIFIPIHLYDVSRHTIKFVARIPNAHNEFDRLSNVALKALSDVGELCGDVAAVATVLKEFIVLPAQLAAHITTFIGVSGIVGSITFVLSARSWYQSHTFRKEIEGNNDFMLKAIFATDPKVLKKHFRVDGKKLKEKVESISPDRVGELASKLRGRIRWREIALGIKMLAATITVVASIILLVHASCPAAFALLATAGALGLLAFVINRIATRSLNKYLDTIVTVSASAPAGVTTSVAASEDALRGVADPSVSEYDTSKLAHIACARCLKQPSDCRCLV